MKNTASNMNGFLQITAILLLLPTLSAAAGTTVFHWEVENGSEPPDMEEKNSGTSVQIENGEGTTNGSYPDSDRTKETSFTVTCDGRYYLQGRYCSRGSSENSWYIHIRQGGSFVTDTEGNNDASGNGSAWSHPNWQCWRTRNVTDDNGSSDTRYWMLNSGTTYTLVIRGREDRDRLTWMEVMRDESYPYSCGPPTPVPTSTPAGPPTAVPTPNLTGTPTYTPQPYTSGLDAGGRLYGLEYIPFPAQSASGNTFYDLTSPLNSASANNGEPRNTARWRIVLKGITATAGETLVLETRIGDTSEAVDCVSGNYDTVEDPPSSGQYRLTMPVRPQNLSRTYAWLNSTQVPFTERVDTVGDPRLIPYKDMLGLPSNMAFAHNYNWFFKDLNDTSFADVKSPWTNRYNPFLTQAKFTGFSRTSGGGPRVDVPRSFWLWRTGLQNSASIYTSMSGFSSYYIGIGGEIGGDGANALSGGVPLSNAPYGGSGGSDHNEITNETQLVRSVSTGASAFRAMPWLGELWPDRAYENQWSSTSSMSEAWGNLSNPTEAGALGGIEAFVRDRRDDCDSSSHGPFGSGVTNYDFKNISRMRTAQKGSGSFMNGSSGGGSFNHYFSSLNAAIMADGSEMGPNYQFALPANYPATRPFGLQAGNGGMEEWNEEPYVSNRSMLDIFSSNNISPTQIGYYRGTPDTTTNRTSACVRSVNPVTKKAAWIIINGFDKAGTAGEQFLSKFAVLTCFRAFHDAGAPTAFAPQSYNNNSNLKNVGGTSLTFRIEPIPLVKIISPSLSDDTKLQSSINIIWQQHYRRWDNQKYTSYYPNLVDDPDDPSAWHSLPTSELVYNLKYSDDGGGNWYMVEDDTLAVPGEYADSYAVTSTARTLYWEWDVTGMAAGNKIFRVECYRQNFAQHYAFHERTIYTSP